MRHRALAFTLCLLAVPAHGQSPLQLGVGQRIWVRSAVVPGTLDAGVQGTLEWVIGDSLHLRLFPGAQTVSVFVGPQTQLFLFNGRRSSAGKGALIGGLVGAGMGALIGFGGGNDGGSFLSSGATAAMAGTLFGVVGAVGGLMLGALSSHDTWTRIGWKSPARPVFSPSPHGIRLGLSLPF